MKILIKTLRHLSIAAFIALALLVMGVFDQAHATQVQMCNEAGHATGDPWSACSAGIFFEISFLGEGALVRSCSGAPVRVFDGCEYNGGSEVMLSPSSAAFTQSVFSSDGWLDPSTVNWPEEYQGSSSSSSISSSTSSSASSSVIPDLSYAQWGQIISAVLLMFVSLAVIGIIRKKAV